MKQPPIRVARIVKVDPAFEDRVFGDAEVAADWRHAGVEALRAIW